MIKQASEQATYVNEKQIYMYLMCKIHANALNIVEVVNERTSGRVWVWMFVWTLEMFNQIF